MQAERILQHALQMRAAIEIVWQSGRFWTIINAGLLIVQGMLPLASLYLMKLVLDLITKQLNTPEPRTEFEQVAVLLVLAAIVALVGAVATIVARLANETQGEARQAKERLEMLLIPDCSG